MDMELQKQLSSDPYDVRFYEEPKYCKCTQSSVAHIKACYTGWAHEVKNNEPKESQEATQTSL